MAGAPHAGFAAAIAVGQEAMQDLLRVLYVANKIPHALDINTPIPTSDGGTGLLFATLTVDLPTIRFRAANNNRFALQVRAFGWLFVNLGGSGAEGRNVLVTLDLTVPPQLAVAAGQLSFGIDGSQALLARPPRVEVTGGAFFPPAINAFLTGPLFTTGVQLALQQQLAQVPAAPLNLAFLGALATMPPQQTVTPRVVDGALLVGFDVGWVSETVVDPLLGVLPTPVYPAEAVRSEGDASALADFRRGYDIAYWINSRHVPIAFFDALSSARAEIEQQDVTIEQLSLRARDGRLRLSGRASTDEGSATFRVDLVPRLTTSEFPWEEVLLFEQGNADVDVDLAAGYVVLQVLFGIVTLGAAALGVDRLVDALRGSLERQLGRGSTTAARRNQQITLPGTNKPPIDVRIEIYRVRREGVFSAMNLTPRLREPTVRGVSRVYADGGGTHADIFYSVRLPPDVVRDDPGVLVQWTLRRDDTNTVADEIHGAAARLAQYRARLSLPGNVTAERLALTCRVYRVRGSRTTDLFVRTVRMRDDPLDRAHPYVRWRHAVPVPYVEVEADGSLTKYGEPIVHRASRIHRTDLPGRCLFAAEISSLAEPEYLDHLPFPVDELTNYRRFVCDYCFFGGPTNTEPLI